jgi:O-antigen/teichoic acid export membrane protein
VNRGTRTRRSRAPDGTGESATKLSHQFGWLVASRIVGSGLQAVILALLARWAGPESFGVTSAVLGVGVAISSAGDLGLGQYVVRVRSRDPRGTEVSAVLKLAGRTSWLVGVVLAVLLGAVGMFSPLVLATIPLALWATMEKISNSWLGVATADGRTYINTIVILVRRGVALAAFTACVALHVPATMAFSTSCAFASALGALIGREAMLATVAHGPHPRADLLRKSWPFWLNSAAGQARGLDVAVVGALGGAVAAGIYSVPARMMSPLRLVPDSLATLLMTSASRDDRRALRSLLTAAVAVATLIGVGLAGLAWLAGPIIEITVGSQYLSATVPLQIFTVGVWAAGASSLAVGLLQGWGSEHYVGVLDVYVTILLLVGAGIGAALGGAAMAAAAASAAYVLNAVVLLIKVCTDLRARRPARHAD